MIFFSDFPYHFFPTWPCRVFLLFIPIEKTDKIIYYNYNNHFLKYYFAEIKQISLFVVL